MAKYCQGICTRFMHQIKTRHSWLNSFDYRVYDFRVVRTIGGRAKESNLYLKCSGCGIFMIKEMVFTFNNGRIRCPCCNTQLSYGMRCRGTGMASNRYVTKL